MKRAPYYIYAVKDAVLVVEQELLRAKGFRVLGSLSSSF